MAGSGYTYENAESTSSAATGGRISTGATIVSAGGIGLVKMLAIAGVVLIGLKILKGGK